MGIIFILLARLYARSSHIDLLDLSQPQIDCKQSQFTDEETWSKRMRGLAKSYSQWWSQHPIPAT